MSLLLHCRPRPKVFPSYKLYLSLEAFWGKKHFLTYGWDCALVKGIQHEEAIETEVTVSLQRHCESSRTFFTYCASSCSHRILWLVSSPISFHGPSGQPGVPVAIWESWLLDKSCQVGSDCQLLLAGQGGLWPPSGGSWTLKLTPNENSTCSDLKPIFGNQSPVGVGYVFVLPFPLLFPPRLEEAVMAASLGSVRDNSAAPFCVLTYLLVLETLVLKEQF